MEKRYVIEKVAFWVFVALVVALSICMGLGVLTIGQQIALMIGYIIIIIYIVSEKAITFAKDEAMVRHRYNMFIEIKEIHSMRYKALLGGEKKRSDELYEEFKEYCQVFEYECHKLQKCSTMNQDQLRSLQVLINMLERLKKDLFVP